MSIKSMTKESSVQAFEHLADFREGVELLKNEYSEKALVKLRKAFETDKRNPFYISFLGLCIARAEQDWNEAIELCETAIRMNRKEIQFHLNLIEVYISAELRETALYKLDVALRLFRNDARLKRLRGKVFKRRAPVFPFLERSHFLNRELGKVRHRILNKLDKR